jgi:hypothetical protein
MLCDMPVTPKYRAFLSYSHRDTRAVARLHARLERYRPGRDLAGREPARGSAILPRRPRDQRPSRQSGPGKRRMAARRCHLARESGGCVSAERRSGAGAVGVGFWAGDHGGTGGEVSGLGGVEERSDVVRRATGGAEIRSRRGGRLDGGVWCELKQEFHHGDHGEPRSRHGERTKPWAVVRRRNVTGRPSVGARGNSSISRREFCSCGGKSAVVPGAPERRRQPP